MRIAAASCCLLCACAPAENLPRGVDPGDPEVFRKAVAAVGCRVADPQAARRVEELTGQTSARLSAVAGYLAGQGELQQIPGGFALVAGPCAAPA